MSHINPIIGNEDPTFEDMDHIIHIDEKWFYLNPDKRRFYLLPSEEDPHRVQQSRRLKLKAMFMAVVGKPLYDTHGVLLHDGKYGMFPFTVKDQAKKSSKNKPVGTWETKAVQNVNREWDNVRPHQIPRDEEFIAATTANGFNIQLVFQPPQSPDLNVLDLRLFRSIQSLQYQSFPSNLDELVEKLIECYETFKPEVNKYIWITLQKCMIMILQAEGGNKYKIPYMNKKKLENLGILPDKVEVQRDIVLGSVEYLNTMFRPATQGTQEAEEDMEVDAD
ncbi:uncharacterized protein LOC110683883 [Chenopodium quinoa]|uniref:uncharacterized protein LOC110683883 n=1 Tax=Chenopodium quinoa TaxID=63459 RepID=UPI000B787503|nr:uncharacterized protein LOC110683883 [Chenopodium quinoa]